MPTYSPPSNDTARAAFLKTALAAAENDHARGNQYVLGETFEKLKGFAPTFESKAAAINQKLSSRSKEVAEGNKALHTLATYLRDAFETARRQVARHDLPAHVLTLYGLPQDGLTPHPTTDTEWLTIGRTFVEGADKVAEQGLPVVSCPSPDEIRSMLDTAAREHADVSAADRNYDEAQEQMAAARGQADELIGDIMAELRLTLRKLDTASQRRIQRSYGARFSYLKGEPVDADDTDPIVAS